MKKLIFLLLFISSCGITKNTSLHAEKTDLNQQNLQLQDEQDLNSSSSNVSIIKDTANVEYTVQIWPKGNVSYSSETGFSGLAEKILVSGKANMGSTASRFAAAAKHNKRKRSAAIKQMDKTTSSQSSQSKKSSPAWKWQLAGLIIVALAAWFVYKRLKNRFHL